MQERYGPEAPAFDLTGAEAVLEGMLRRGSCRAFTDAPVDPGLIELLCATALASPTKSDLQQRDIIVLRDPGLRQQLCDLVAGQAWVQGAPNLLVFCGNNRRQRRLHELRGHAFANDHLDAFFNAAVDAGIALSAFVTAAEAVGLGCCPISAVRNEAAAVSDLLGLPDHVFPVAGLALGVPVEGAQPVSMRLPLTQTVHVDRYNEDGLDTAIADYDQRRETAQPYAQQRGVAAFGQAETYGWSEDKTRQYALPERETFGAFVRAKGFDLG